MRAALLLFPSLGVLACGSRSELYAIGGGLRDGGDDVSLGADASEDAPEDAPIDVGPDVMCKGKAISVTLNAPNLYFVIDHSFSMNEMNKWSNIRTAVSNLMTQLGAGARFGAALFPGGDTSGNCQVGIEVMSVRQGDPNGVVANTFLNATTAPPQGGTPTAATLLSLVPKLSALTGKTFVILATDGGPNCNSSLSCPAYLCTSNLDSVSPDCTPDFVNNCCDPNANPQGNPQGCLDDTGAENAAAQLFSHGISTYVMGIPGSANYANVLDELAISGGTARTSEPLYYQVMSADEAALSASFAQIVQQTGAGCSFSLAQAPSFPSGLEVFLSGVNIPAGGPNGYTVQGRTLTLSGTSCAMVRNAGAPALQFFDGCR